MMNAAGVSFWIGLLAAAVAFSAGQLVSNRGVRSAVFGFALLALVTTGLAGAAWATTSG
jgi:hypothetical protein